MSSLNLLYKDRIPVTEDIYICIPTIGEILEKGVDNYYGLVSMLTAMPIDMMVILDEMGIDFTEINDYELFLRCFPAYVAEDTSLIFGDLDLSKFVLAQREDTNDIVLVDPEHDIVIDRRVQQIIASTLRNLHNLEKNKRKPANREAKEYMLERAKIKAKRKKKTVKTTELERTIVAMVNCEQFKYDFETVKSLTIFQFNQSVQQVMHKLEYEHLWNGIYSGTVDAGKLRQEQLMLLKKD